MSCWTGRRRLSTISVRLMDELHENQPSKKPDRGEDTAIAESGVDRTLIRWMLTLSPIERLEFVQRHVNAVQEMTEGSDSE